MIKRTFLTIIFLAITGAGYWAYSSADIIYLYHEDFESSQITQAQYIYSKFVPKKEVMRDG